MDLSTNRASEYGSTRTTTDPIPPKSKLNAFDLVKVGLSSTFAISVFIGIGYVVKHVAGPSAILSVFFAAFIAYLAGNFEFFFPTFCEIILQLSGNNALRFLTHLFFKLTFHFHGFFSPVLIFVFIFHVFF